MGVSRTRCGRSVGRGDEILTRISEIGSLHPRWPVGRPRTHPPPARFSRLQRTASDFGGKPATAQGSARSARIQAQAVALAGRGAVDKRKRSRAGATWGDKRGYIFLGTVTAASLAMWLRSWQA
jgi:hypothetical protein